MKKIRKNLVIPPVGGYAPRYNLKTFIAQKKVDTQNIKEKEKLSNHCKKRKKNSKFCKKRCIALSRKSSYSKRFSKRKKFHKLQK